jgi:hypothetical protein
VTARTPDRAPFWSRSRILAFALGALALSVFIGANAHLIAVSFSSQPACVPHLKLPQEGAAQYRAAVSSC